MSEVSKDLRNIFFPKIPPILELEVGFFSTKKKFFQDFFFARSLIIIFSELNMKIFSAKSEKLFREVGREGGRSL